MTMRPQDLDERQLAYYSAVSHDLQSRKLESSHYVPKLTGRAIRVGKHDVLRITCPDGPQVCDFNAFCATDPAEHFWSGRTRTLQGSHMKVGRQLWSTEPRMRPMMTLITDTVPRRQLPYNAATHDLIYARCSNRAVELKTGKKGQPNCNDNLKKALEEIGFPSTYVHDAFNIFMTTGHDNDHRLFWLPSEARKGDFVELYAEIDLIIAVSCCPGGSSGSISHGLLLEVFSQPNRPT